MKGSDVVFWEAAGKVFSSPRCESTDTINTHSTSEEKNAKTRIDHDLAFQQDTK